MQSSGPSTRRRCPWQNSTEQNENNIFFFRSRLSNGGEERKIAHYEFIRATCIQLNWLNGLCVTVVRQPLPLPPLIRAYSVFMFSSVRSIIWFHFLFVCVRRGTEKTTKKKNKAKWNENRLKLTHRRADLVLHMQFTSVNPYMSFFSCFEFILDRMSERKTNPLPLCMCRSALWLLVRSAFHIFRFFFSHFAHNRKNRIVAVLFVWVRCLTL